MNRIWKVLVPLTVLLCVSCRKDTPISEEGVCLGHWDWSYTGEDTLYFGQFGSTFTMYLEGLPGYEGDSRIGMGYNEQDMNPGPGVFLHQSISFAGLSWDSIACILKTTPGPQCLRYYSPGDIICTTDQIQESVNLYDSDYGNCPHNISSRYIGLVKLIRNKRHCGYAKVSSEDGRYWIEKVRFAKCPDMAIMVE